jgi:PilZ domain
MPERRCAVRTTENKPAWLLYEDTCIVACTVADVSATGAGLVVPSAVPLPSTFDLFINPTTDGYCCRVVWRAADRLGVSFQ